MFRISVPTIAFLTAMATVVISPAVAHGPGGQYGSYGMMGPGMMGPGMMGPGMMAPGYGMMMGPGMMGPGMMGPGMMGPGYGMWSRGDVNLKADDVRKNLERWLAWQGNPRLKVGDVKEEGEDTIVAEIVTKEESALVDRMRIDRTTGAMRRIE